MEVLPKSIENDKIINGLKQPAVIRESDKFHERVGGVERNEFRDEKREQEFEKGWRVKKRLIGADER